MKFIGSIVIPVFQSHLTLRRALDSITKSIPAERSVEVILVFDGPDERSEEIFRTWEVAANVIAKSQVIERSGVSQARNFGAQMATGTNITFLDADDEFTASRAEALAQDIAGTILIGKQEIVISPNLHYQEALLHPSEYHLMSLVMNREEFIRLGCFAEEYGVGGEWDFSIRAREIGIELVKSDQYFLRRYIHSDNASHENKSLKIEHLKAIREHIARSRN